MVFFRGYAILGGHDITCGVGIISGHGNFSCQGIFIVHVIF